MKEAVVKTGTQAGAVYRHEFTVPDDAIDRNQHVNNVVYVQWMQDVAILHADATGSTRAMDVAGATWVVRSHMIEYLSPAFEGDRIVAMTWVVNFRKVRSLRRYKFVRKSDNKILARGETDWVTVDKTSGRLCAVPVDAMNAFSLLPEDQEP
jgi:acyl-CoA thioester hydrolase